MNLLTGLTICLFLLPSLVIAQEQTLMTTRGALLFEDDFARPELKPKWNVGLGLWEIKDGVATAAEKPEDRHGAYAFITPNTTYKEVIAEFDFKMNGASDLVLNMREMGFKGSQAGHILRVSIMQNKVQVAGDELLFVVDGKPVAYLKSSGVDHPTKNMLGFTIAGKGIKTASIKNPNFWHATPNPEWVKQRAEMLADC